MKIIWGSRARTSYQTIRSQIRARFTENEEAAFVMDVFQTITAIEKFPKAFPESKSKQLKGTRKAVVHPHSTLFYRIEGKNTIRLLLFWDNRDNPLKLK